MLQQTLHYLALMDSSSLNLSDKKLLDKMLIEANRIDRENHNINIVFNTYKCYSYINI